MGQRLRGKNQKQARDRARARKEGTNPKRHKVAEERSKKAKFKKNNRV